MSALLQEPQVIPVTSGGPPEPKPKGPFGQGKKAVTILADQGDHVTVITDVPYLTRSRVLPPLSRPPKGSRSMHQTTLNIRTNSSPDYNTSYQVHHANGRNLYTQEKPHACPSQHTTQFSFKHSGEADSSTGRWGTNYAQDYAHKQQELMKSASLANRKHMLTGTKMQEVLDGNHGKRDYWTHYTRTHSKLGAMLGHGVDRERPVRRQYNILTGDDQGQAWFPDNKRMSGNRILYNHMGRNMQSRHFIVE